MDFLCCAVLFLMCILLIAKTGIEIIALLGAYAEYKKIMAKEEDELLANVDENTVIAIKQQQLYNVEKYKERMQKMREEDADGLFEEEKAITLEELGFFTGVE